MKKIRIGICDDFEVIAQKLKKVIEEVWDIPEVECEVLTWTDGLLMLEQAALECYTLFRTFTVYTKRNKLEFSLKQIQCVKAYDGYAQVYIDGSWYRRNSSLDELEEELDARLFMRIHRKMIVNMCWVERDAEGDFWLFGEPLPISRRKKKEFLHRYTQYILKYRRILMT